MRARVMDAITIGAATIVGGIVLYFGLTVDEAAHKKFASLMLEDDAHQRIAPTVVVTRQRRALDRRPTAAIAA